LREIPYCATTPQVVVLPPSDHSELSSANQSPVYRQPMDRPGELSKSSKKDVQYKTLSENEPSENFSGTQRKNKKKKKRHIAVNGKQEDDGEQLTPRRKKKQRANATKGEGEGERELPPLMTMGRPLPTLPSLPASGELHEESPC